MGDYLMQESPWKIIDTMMQEHQESLRPKPVRDLRAPLDLDAIAALFRGEQPDEPALPVDGALRGDVPLSSTTNESEEF